MALKQFDPEVIALTEAFAEDVQSQFDDLMFESRFHPNKSYYTMTRRQTVDVYDGMRLLNDAELPGSATKSVVWVDVAVPRLGQQPRRDILALAKVSLCTLRLDASESGGTASFTKRTKEIGTDHDGLGIGVSAKTKVKELEFIGRGILTRETLTETRPQMGTSEHIEDLGNMYQQMAVLIREGKALEEAGVQKYLLT